MDTAKDFIIANISELEDLKEVILPVELAKQATFEDAIALSQFCTMKLYDPDVSIHVEDPFDNETPAQIEICHDGSHRNIYDYAILQATICSTITSIIISSNKTNIKKLDEEDDLMAGLEARLCEIWDYLGKEQLLKSPIARVLNRINYNDNRDDPHYNNFFADYMGYATKSARKV